MSEGLQTRSARLSRAERTTTSCGECRRRKQKCDQKQPCGNCARRFPQPLCEYRPSKRPAVPGFSHLPTFTVTLRAERFADNEIPGTREPLLEAPQPPWALIRRNNSGGEVVIWSGVDMATRFPRASAYPNQIWNYPWTSEPQSSTVPGEVNLPVCGKNCTLHSQAAHDAVRLLLHKCDIPRKFLDYEWDPHNMDELIAYQGETMGSPWGIGGPTDELRHLPMAPTRQNGELLRIYLKLLSRFKASLDGNPEPNNPVIKHYLPYCVQDPLLLQITLYTSACFLNETGHLPRPVVMVQKGRAIGMLNEHLRSDAFYTSDSAIAAVVQLVIDEWYWGETHDLRAHLRGMREMVRIRGGLHRLGMNGLLAKMVIVHDVAIALTHEINPFLQNSPEFEFHDPVTVPFRMSHNTPLVSGLASFTDCAESLNMNPATASILDDMRFLLHTVLAMPAEPTPQELQKLKTTATWMHDRISKLEAQIPSTQRATSPTAPGGRSLSSTRASISSASGVKIQRSRSEETRIKSEPVTEGGDERRASSASMLAPADAQRNTARGSSPSLSPSPFPTEEPPPRPDFMYHVVRKTALVYARAVMERRSLSKTCTPTEFLEIWTTTWRTPLSTWRSMVGVFIWIMLAIVTSSPRTPHERFVKSMLVLSLQTLGMDNWHVATGAMQAGMKLEKWLREEEEAAERKAKEKKRMEGMMGPGSGSDSEGRESMVGEDEEDEDERSRLEAGGKTISEHGYHQPEEWTDPS